MTKAAMKCRIFLGEVITVLVMLCASLVAGTALATENAYPSHSIRLIVPFSPGGGVDLVARIIAPKLSSAMGQNWVVENRPGAGGNIAAASVARAKPDGYTVLAALNTQVTANPSLYEDMSFDAEKDLLPITMIAVQDHIVVISPSVPAKTLKELIDLSKGKLGTLSFASAGIGSSTHLGGELLKKRSGIDMVHIPYKGTGPAIADMLGGQTQVMVGGFAATIPYVQSGKLRALATTGLKRSKLLPDVPTVAESGYPGFEVIAWIGLFVPAATPPSIVKDIQTAVLRAMDDVAVQAALGNLGMNVETSTPNELAARIKSESAVWAGVIKDAHISVK